MSANWKRPLAVVLTTLMAASCAGHPKGVMTPAECVRLIVAAMGSRKREEIMTLKGKLGQWLKLIAPSVIDNMARKAVAGNAAKVDAPIVLKKH